MSDNIPFGWMLLAFEVGVIVGVLVVGFMAGATSKRNEPGHTVERGSTKRVVVNGREVEFGEFTSYTTTEAAYMKQWLQAESGSYRASYTPTTPERSHD